MKEQNPNRKGLSLRAALYSPYFWLFVVISGLFGFLFIRFILGEYAYVYRDTGSDTLFINYPLYYMFSDIFQGGGYEAYSLNVGLGADISSYFYQYLNPINLMVLLLPTKYLPWSILLATYFKLLLMGFFGYQLFEKWIRHTWGSFAAAILWTFSGYSMLWGQHYGFLTSVALFTVFLYLVHLYVDDSERSRNGVLTFWIALMLISNYYFLYMAAIFGALYVVIWLLFQKAPVKKMLTKLTGLLGMGILGVCMGGVCLVPTANAFLSSTRGEGISSGLGGIFSLFGPRWMLSVLGRFFSNNTLGIDQAYSGELNYYEIAMLAVSSLVLPGLLYLFTKKKARLRAAVLTVVSLILLALPITGQILVMNPNCHRWTYVLCLLEALVVGLYIKDLMTETDRKRLWFGIIGSGALTVGLFAILWWGQSRYGYEVEAVYLVIFAAFLAVYGVLALINTYLPAVKRAFPVILTAVLCVEVWVIQYPALNERDNPTRQEIAAGYYNDGAREAYKTLKTQDDSVYRIAKDYYTGLVNEGMGQSYPGFSVYSTTNPAGLVSLKKMYVGLSTTDSLVLFNNGNYLFQALLGMKYTFAKQGSTLQDSYTYVGTEGTVDIYRYENALPFGYLYDEAWTKDQVEAASVIDRTRAAVHGFYFSDGSEAEGYADASLEELLYESFLERDYTSNDCAAERTEDGIRITGMGEDPYIVFEDVTDLFEGDGYHVLTVRVNAEQNTNMTLYYKTDAQQKDFNGYQQMNFTVLAGGSDWTAVLPGGITDLRLDVSTPVEEVTVEDVRIGDCGSDQEAYDKLRESGVSNTQFEDGEYRAEVTNASGDVQMLCVPLIYGPGWTAAIDGETVELYDINSGLCGVEIPSGTHAVTLTYETPHKTAGIAMTGAGFALWLLIFGGGWLRRKKHTKTS